MKRVFIGKVLLFVLLFICTANLTDAQTRVSKVFCDYQTNPLGIDSEKPQLSWQLVSGGQNIIQTAFEIRVATDQNDLQRGRKLLWSSGKVESGQSVNVEYAGPAIPAMQRVYWQVRVWDKQNKRSDWSEPAYWETGITSPDLWTARWITLPGEPENSVSLPVHQYRREFSTRKKIKSARIYATAHGLYQLYLNGQKVGDQLFTPGWTSYNKTLQYQTYDVTSMLGAENTFSALLGDGWYRGYIGFNGQRNYYGNKLALLVQLRIDYTDGSSETIGTDATWKAGTGAIQKSDIYNGEYFDANHETFGWMKNGFDDTGWKFAVEQELPKDVLVAQQGFPVRAVEEIRAKSKTTTPAGDLVYDLGQNMVGWARVKMSGQKGDTVRIRFAEVLDRDGNFYTANLRGAQCTDTYVFSENGEVEFEPHFTFHGFRYIAISGLENAPVPEDVTGVVIHSDMPTTGSFECNNQLINQLQHNIRWGQKGNFLDVPTDCPQRDERLGWTGDAQVFSMTAGYNFNVAAFYKKWMHDFVNDQQENGAIPHVIPNVLGGWGGGATGWADAVAIIPWTVYRIYGDKKILEETYPAIIKWIAFMNERAGEDHLWTGDYHFGDWLAFATTNSDYPGATTEKDLIATAYFYYTTNLAAKIAGIIGKPEEAEQFKGLAGDIKKAFTSEFITPNGRLVSHTQTAYVLALSFGLMPADREKAAAAYLAADVEKFGHLTTGFLGTPLLCQTLSAIGRDDLAFKLLMRETYPSWLYPVTQGATTIWERWDGQKPDGSFQDVGMNSFNHYAYGAIGEWLYSHVAGIRIDEKQPGYKHFWLAPHTGGGLYHVKASFDSMYGTIRSEWTEEKGILVYTVEVPENTTATVVLPFADKGKVEMTGELKNVAGQIGDDTQVTIGSGTYTFSYPYLHR